MKYLFFIIILILFQINLNFSEGFDGCEIHFNNRLQNIFEENNQSYPMRGFTSNEYLYKMEDINLNEPIPVNANFFLGKY